MRIIFRALSIAGLIGLGFVSGAITAGMRQWFQPIAHVTIENESGHDITEIKFTHVTGGIKSTMQLPALRDGQSTAVHFFIAGEGGYGLDVMLSNGLVLKTNGGYIESGYRSTEVVRPNSIESKAVNYGS